MIGLTIPQALVLLLTMLFYILSMGATWVALLNWREDLMWRWENGFHISEKEHRRWMRFCRTSLHRFTTALFFPVGFWVIPRRSYWGA